jgi:hypothetical protein
MAHGWITRVGLMMHVWLRHGWLLLPGCWGCSGTWLLGHGT